MSNIGNLFSGDTPEEIAERQAREAREEQRRLEEKFGLTPGELDRQNRTFELEKKQQKFLEERGGKSGEQILRDTGDITDSLLDVIQKRLPLSSQELFLQDTGKVGQQLFDEISGFDEGLFKQELDLVNQRVNQQANRRGVFGGQGEGSIRLENLGRAGADLAIRKATERLNQRQQLANIFLNLSNQNRSEAGLVSSGAINAQDQARNELNQFLANMQALDQQSKGRAANAAINAGSIASGQISQSFDDLQSSAGFNKAFQTDLFNQGLEALGSAGSAAFTGGVPVGGAGGGGVPGADFLSQTKGRDPFSGLALRSGRNSGLIGAVP